MKRHISIFTFLLGAVFAVGLHADLCAAETIRANYVSTRGSWNGNDTKHITPTQGAIESGRKTPVTFTALPTPGHQVTRWLWNDDVNKVGRGGESDMSEITGSDQYRKVSGDKKTCTVSYSGEGTRALGIRFDYMPLTVTFGGNGATSGKMDDIKDKNYDSSFSLTANAYAKTGYSFDGWTNDRGKPFTDGSSVKGSDFWDDATGEFHAVLNALWMANTYTVTFNGNGGSTPGSMSVTYDSTYGTLPTSMRTGYTFAGWYTAAGGGTKIEAGTKVQITANQTLWAHWTANTYTVTFDKNGGNAPSKATQTVTYDSTYGSLATCTRTGYTFAGWWTAASGGKEVKAETKVEITGAQTLYAHWTPNIYTISYTGLREGSIHTNRTTYTIPDSDIVFTPASDPSGYKFSGWNPPLLEAGSTGDKTVTANYLTITFKPDVHSPLTYNGYLQSCADHLPNGVTAKGYQAKDVGTYEATFTPSSGYCWDDGKKTPYVIEWKIIAAKITDAKVEQTGTLTYTGEPRRPTVQASATVTGSQPTWKYSMTSGGYAETLPEFTDAGTYKVYFEVSAPNYESAYGSFSVTVERARTAEVVLSQTQFSYTGLEQGPDVTFTNCREDASSVKRATQVGIYSVKATPNDNYAWSDGGTSSRNFEWRIGEATFMATVSAGEGGTGGMAFSYKSSSAEQQKDIAHLPTRTGYWITEWIASDYVGDPPTISGTIVTIPAGTAGDFILTPTWEPITYTIDFDGNGGKGEMEPKTLVYDEVYVVPGCGFDFTGATFQCWNVLSGDKAVTNYEAGVTVSNLTTVADAHLTFRAEWQTNSYTVAFLSDRPGETMPDQKFRYGEAKSLLKCTFDRVKSELWHFEGWTNSAGRLYADEDTVSNLTAQADGRVELMAVWSSTIGELSIAMGCDNLKWESEPWKVCDSEGYDGPPCVWQVDGYYVGMHAHIVTNGVLSFKYRLTTEADKIRVTIGQFPDGNPVMTDAQWIFTYQKGVEWQDAVCEIQALEWDSAYIRVYHQNFNESGIAYVDQLTWTPEGAHPEPSPGEPVAVTAAGVEDGVFSLTIPTTSGVDYGVWTNADLTVDSWGLMGEPQKGDGNPWKVEWTILPGFPQLFFRAHKVEYK